MKWLAMIMVSWFLCQVHFAFGDDYLNEIMVWPFDHYELTVVIDPSLAEISSVIHDACSEWAQATDGNIKFVFLDIPPPYPHAGERIKWTDDFLLPEFRQYGFDILITGEKSNGSGAAGATWCNGGMSLYGKDWDAKKAWPLLLGIEREEKYKNLSPDSRLYQKFADIRLDFGTTSPETLRSVILHEIGHALFCAGHSSNPTDIMSIWGERQSLPELSERDINSVRLVYPPLPEEAARKQPDDFWILGIILEITDDRLLIKCPYGDNDGTISLARPWQDPADLETGWQKPTFIARFSSILPFEVTLSPKVKIYAKVLQAEIDFLDIHVSPLTKELVSNYYDESGAIPLRVGEIPLTREDLRVGDRIFLRGEGGFTIESNIIKSQNPDMPDYEAEVEQYKVVFLNFEGVQLDLLFLGLLDRIGIDRLIVTQPVQPRGKCVTTWGQLKR